MYDFFNSHINIIAQCIGFVAMGLEIVSFQFNKRKTILTIQVVMSLIWTGHYLCLGVMTGMAMNFLSALRFFVYSQRDKKWAQYNFWPFVFSALFLTAGIITYENWTSILPIVSMILASFVMWSTSTKKLRIFYTPCSALWLIYNIINGSVAGAANEMFVLSSIAVAFMRFDRKKNSEDESKAIK